MFGNLRKKKTKEYQRNKTTGQEEEFLIRMI